MLHHVNGMRTATIRKTFQNIDHYIYMVRGPTFLLDLVRQQFVHFCNFGRNAEVNCALADLNDKSTLDVGIHLCQ